MVFLIETSIKKNKLEVVRRKIGFDGCFGVDSIGRNRSLAVMWKAKINFELFSL